MKSYTSVIRTIKDPCFFNVNTSLSADFSVLADGFTRVGVVL